MSLPHGSCSLAEWHNPHDDRDATGREFRCIGMPLLDQQRLSAMFQKYLRSAA